MPSCIKIMPFSDRKHTIMESQTIPWWSSMPFHQVLLKQFIHFQNIPVAKRAWNFICVSQILYSLCSHYFFLCGPHPTWQCLSYTVETSREHRNPHIHSVVPEKERNSLVPYSTCHQPEMPTPFQYGCSPESHSQVCMYSQGCTVPGANSSTCTSSNPICQDLSGRLHPQRSQQSLLRQHCPQT